MANILVKKKIEDSQSSLHVITDDHHLTLLDTKERMETEKMDVQFEHETSEECVTSLQDNENTADIQEKQNKPPGSFLTKLACRRFHKGIRFLQDLELDQIRHKIK